MARYKHIDTSPRFLAGIRQSASQQAAQSRNATRQNQGRWAVEALLHGACCMVHNIEKLTNDMQVGSR